MNNEIPKYEFCVITSIPDLLDPDGGNLCTSFMFEYYDNINKQNSYAIGLSELPAAKPVSLCHTPVFQKGEILIVDTSGREIPYPGRKPSKWYVTAEYFKNIEEAIKKAIEVKEEE